jgi:YidC/Oxa1 family membrane protein insertase
MQQQQRFIIALVASAAVLILWNYFFPPIKPPQPNANGNNQPVATGSPTPSSQPSTNATPSPAANQPTPAPPVAADNVPPRKVRVVTPLYDITFDSRGGVATSWIIKKVKKDDGSLKDMYAAASTKTDRKPLELIPAPPEGVTPEQMTHPFQVITDDPAVDAVLSSRNFKVAGSVPESGEASVDVANGTQQLTLTAHDDATAIDITKTFTFYADRYLADVAIKLTRNNQPVPQVKVVAGPNVSDQSIDHYTLYLYAPEGIALVNGEVRRINATEVHADRRNSGLISWALEGLGLKSPVMKPADHDVIDGQIQWAGVDDTYFGMILVPPRPITGLEYRSTAYQHKTNGKPDERFLITGLVPVPADGSKTQVYVGPKDHRLLENASKEIANLGGPKVDLGDVINYGFLGSMRRFLAVPILFAIEKLQRATSSYGVAIILFTIFIYSLFFPLKWQSSRKMKKAQKYAPRMKELQEKLKGMKQSDPRMKELQMEQLRLMKEANPLGGCLPLLIQMPFLFALYSAITISIDFRQASFLWIPDLSGPEPYLLGFIRLLPLLFAGSMIFLQLLTPAPSADPLQRKMMAIGMPLFMLYILWSAPAGLLLYWLVGNIVGFLQQIMINKLTKDEEPPPDEKAAKKKSPKKLAPAEA